MITSSIQKSYYGREMPMDHVTVSPKFQVVIPKAVREALGIRPGQKLAVLAKGRTVLFVPVLPLKALRGIAEGVDLSDYRDHEDRP